MMQGGQGPNNDSMNDAGMFGKSRDDLDGTIHHGAMQRNGSIDDWEDLRDNHWKELWGKHMGEAKKGWAKARRNARNADSDDERDDVVDRGPQCGGSLSCALLEVLHQMRLRIEKDRDEEAKKQEMT
eukprot:gene7705-1593_t